MKYIRSFSLIRVLNLVPSSGSLDLIIYAIAAGGIFATLFLGRVAQPD